MIRPGDYRFELLLSSDNSKKIEKRWTISFGPAWSNDEQTMLRNIALAEFP